MHGDAGKKFEPGKSGKAVDCDLVALTRRTLDLTGTWQLQSESWMLRTGSSTAHSRSFPTERTCGLELS
jgi:hypothetical protein